MGRGLADAGCEVLTPFAPPTASASPAATLALSSCRSCSSSAATSEDTLRFKARKTGSRSAFDMSHVRGSYFRFCGTCFSRVECGGGIRQRR